MNKKQTTGEQISRGFFICKTDTAAAAISIVPSHVISRLGHRAPSDKLNITGVGVGSMGFGNLQRLENENITGLCDVDWS